MAKIVNLYPVGIQTFSNIREGNYLYVDKTKYIVDFREKKWSTSFWVAQDDSENLFLPLPFKHILREGKNFSKDWPLQIMRRNGSSIQCFILTWAVPNTWAWSNWKDIWLICLKSRKLAGDTRLTALLPAALGLKNGDAKLTYLNC